jgi:hypothetical protein
MMLREAAVALRVQHKLVWPYAIGGSVAAICYIPLIIFFGGLGAAAALVLAESVVLFLLLRTVQRAVGHAVSLRTLVHVGLSGLAGILAMSIVAWFDVAAWARLAVGVGVYGLSLSATGAVNVSTLVGILRAALPGRSTLG